ncbi:hypothetical protein OAT18_01550 [Tenacibaculum sp.]|nr:hypothetical protein [Tenacibaculum sp.]
MEIYKVLKSKLGISILLSFIWGNIYSQCWFSDLTEYIGKDNVSVDFKNFIKSNEDAFPAYKILYDEGSLLRTNLEELTLVSNNLDKIKESGSYTKWKVKYKETFFITKLEKFKLGKLSNKFNGLSITNKVKFLDDFSDLGEKALKDLGKDNVFKGWLNFRDEIKKINYEVVKGYTELNSLESIISGDSHLEKLYDVIKKTPAPKGQETVKVAVKHKDHIDFIEVKHNFKTGDGASNKISFDDMSPELGTPFGDYFNGVGEEIMHPIFRERAEYINFLRKNFYENNQSYGNNFKKLIDKKFMETISDVSEFDKKLNNANFAGAHGEIRSLSALIFKMEKRVGMARGTFPVNRLGEIDMIIKNKNNQVMQRCPCCFYLTQGVNVIGGK